MIFQVWRAATRVCVFCLNYDFCPWINRWVYWVKRPIACLLLAAATAMVCGIFVKSAAFIALGAVLLVILAGVFWPLLTIRGLSGSISFAEPRGREGESQIVIVRIHNQWPWSAWGFRVEGGFDNHTVALACIPGWSSAQFNWQFIPSCRGEYPRLTPQLITGFPFGIRSAKREMTVIGSLIVWPKVYALTNLLDAAETRPSDSAISERRVGDFGDPMGSRFFQQGDSLRRMNWKQTARTGEMIVTERQAPAKTAIRVVFDTDPVVHWGQGPDSSFEWTIRIAASICAAYQRENAIVECCFSHTTCVIAPGTSGWQLFMDRLTRLELQVDRGHHHVCRRIHHHHCGAFQVTVTTDQGLAHRIEHRHVHGDQRWIVLTKDEEAEGCQICGQAHRTFPPHSTRLRCHAELADEFRQKWRQICHAG